MAAVANSPQTVVKPAETPTNQGGLTTADLFRHWQKCGRLPISTTSTISNRAKPGQESAFQEWSRQYDPDGKAWTFEGEGKKKRFFQLD